MAMVLKSAVLDRVAGHAADLERRIEILAVIDDMRSWSRDGDGGEPMIRRVDCGAAFEPPAGWRRIEVDLGDLGDYYASDAVASRFERFDRELRDRQVRHPVRRRRR